MNSVTRGTARPTCDHARVKGFCRVVRECEGRGEITRQQARTLMGQAKHGDVDGALRGLGRLYG